MPRYMMWAVGEDGDEYDFSALTPEQVASRAAAMLTDLSYLDGERLYSLGGVRPGRGRHLPGGRAR